jgi:hypothetical protein
MDVELHAPWLVEKNKVLVHVLNAFILAFDKKLAIPKVLNYASICDRGYSNEFLLIILHVLSINNGS